MSWVVVERCWWLRGEEDGGGEEGSKDSGLQNEATDQDEAASPRVVIAQVPASAHTSHRIRERERETHTHRDRQTDRQRQSSHHRTERQTDRDRAHITEQRDRQTETELTSQNRERDKIDKIILYYTGIKI